MGSDRTGSGSAIKPRLDFSEGGNSVTLASGAVAAPCRGTEVIGRGEATLDLLPRPAVHIRCVFDNPMTSIDPPADASATTRVRLDGIPIEGWPGGPVAPGIKEPGSYETLIAREPVQVLGDEDTMMSRVLVHLFNLRFRGSPLSQEQDGKGVYVIFHIDLESTPWIVRIRSLASTFRRQDELLASGGHRLTHVAEVSQTRGDRFSGKEVDEVLKELRNFLWFAKGGPCDLVCPTGLDEDGQEVWARWSSPHRTRAETPLCWFDRERADPLVELFSGYRARWKMPGWRDALASAIDSYTQANAGPRVDLGISLCQVALERLAYEYLVCDRRGWTKEQFRKRSAARKIRAMLTDLKIPCSFPPERGWKEFAVEAAARRWADGPHAIAEIRNALVHPDKGGGALPLARYVDAWRLATWYLEMTILALCSYRGTYWSRKTSERDVKVPWART